MQLSERQRQILEAVVREYAASRRPVGSRTLVERGLVAASPSTVRSELGRLEELGLLEHPHTSAGRVPTDRGYRYFVDEVLTDERARGTSVAQRAPLDLADVGSRIDEALQQTTEALADATHLLAIVTAPAARGAVVRHVEVLRVQARMVVVVCITETGEVTRHVAVSESPLDPGLVDWAAAYLNEEVTGKTLGQNVLRQRLANPELSPAERRMLAMLAPAFTEILDRAQDVHVGGTPALIAELGTDVRQIVGLVSMLDERRRLLDSLRRSLGSGRVAVRIGGENDLPELRPLSVVGAAYGLPARPLGIVGLIGPRAMDYRHAMQAAGLAADRLNAIVEDLYSS